MRQSHQLVVEVLFPAAKRLTCSAQCSGLTLEMSRFIRAKQ